MACPETWIGMVRSSMAKLTPYFSTNRMVREYVETYYRPLAEEYEERVARDGAVGAEVFAWRHNLTTFWNTVHIGDAHIELRDDHYLIKVSLLLGEVPPEDVRIEVYAEPEVGAEGGVLHGHAASRGAHRRRQRFHLRRHGAEPPAAGDYSIRVIPSNPNAAVPLEAQQILWKNCG